MILANKIINVVRWIEIHSSCISLLSKRYSGTDRVEMRNRFSIGQQLLAMSKYLIFTTPLMKMVQQKTTREPESFDRFLLHWCILFTQETFFEDCVLQPSSTAIALFRPTGAVRRFVAQIIWQRAVVEGLHRHLEIGGTSQK